MSNNLLLDSLKVFVAILLVGLVYNLIFYTTDIYYMNTDKDESFDFAYNSLLTMWLPGSAAAAVLYFAYCKFVMKKK